MNIAIKNLFFVLFVYSFIFPITGMELPGDDRRAPSTPPAERARPANPGIYADSLSLLLSECIEQIHNVHKIFSGEYTKEKQPQVRVKDIKNYLAKGLLENVFVPYFKVPRAHRFTPECKKSLGTHLKDIDGNSPKEFLKKGTADFMKSVNSDDFYTIETHEQNTFFIQKVLIDPEHGFGLYRSYQNTIIGSPKYGKYNVLKLLDTENPETHSGPVEFHHVYQNPEVVTTVPYSEHKGNTTLYHKSKKDSRIDRVSCSSEFYFLKKLIGLIQVAKMCSRVLHDCDELAGDVLNNMAYIDAYAGNLHIARNPGAEQKQKQKYTVEMAFSTHLALAPHGHGEEEEKADNQLIISGLDSDDSNDGSTQTGLSRSGTEGHTSHSDLEEDDDDSNISFTQKRVLEQDFSTSSSAPLSPVRNAKRVDKKRTPTRIGKENGYAENTHANLIDLTTDDSEDEEEDFTGRLLGKGNSHSLFSTEKNISRF